MKLRKSYIFYMVGSFILAGLFVFLSITKISEAYANDNEKHERNFVTIHDGDDSLTIKTDAKTVGEALSRAKIDINENDLVDPEETTEIDSNNFHIDLYRARPVIIKDGASKKYLMTAQYDRKLLAEEAGIELSSNDELKSVQGNGNILEAGLSEVYEVSRGEKVADKYEKVEEKTFETLKLETPKEPVSVSIPAFTANPDEATCKAWIRAAGVSETDVETAYWMITKESHCRYNATNKSSGAYGIPQALPGNKMASVGSDWMTNPITQIKWMISYVNGRYGGWNGALAWWNAHHWY